MDGETVDTYEHSLQAKLRDLCERVHRWLSQVLRGHYAYFGLPNDFQALHTFHQKVRLLWFRSLRRRSQRRMTWEGYDVLLRHFSLPTPRITHSCEEQRA